MRDALFSESIIKYEENETKVQMGYLNVTNFRVKSIGLFT